METITLELESGKDAIDILIALMLLRNVATTEDVKLNDLTKRVTQQVNEMFTQEEIEEMWTK